MIFGKKNYYLLFDIGASRTRIGFSCDFYNISKWEIFETPREPIFLEEIFTKFLNQYNLAGKITKSAGGIAGIIDKKNNKIWRSPHLPKWKNFELKNELTRIIRAPVFLENDTAMVGLGEATFGSGKNYNIVAYITISTGVNGVRIINKKIDISSQGFEIGHQLIDFDANINFNDHGSGELEDFISGSSLEKRFKTKPFEIEDKKVWREVERSLAVGIHNTNVYWSPEIVVLGGSLIKKISIDNVENFLEDFLNPFPNSPKIVFSKLKDIGGLYGSLYYLKSNIDFEHNTSLY